DAALQGSCAVGEAGAGGHEQLVARHVGYRERQLRGDEEGDGVDEAELGAAAGGGGRGPFDGAVARGREVDGGDDASDVLGSTRFAHGVLLAPVGATGPLSLSTLRVA